MNPNDGYITHSTDPGGSRVYEWVTHREMVEHTTNVKRDIDEQLVQLWGEIRDIRVENNKRANQTVLLLMSILVAILLNLIINVPFDPIGGL